MGGEKNTNTEREKLSLEKPEVFSKEVKNKPRERIIVPILAFLIVAALLFLVFIISDTMSTKNYERGVQATLDGEYEEAIRFFSKSNIDQAVDQIEYVTYHQNAVAAYRRDDYKEAYDQVILILASYPAYYNIWELKEELLEKLCEELLEKAEHAFENFEYVKAYNYLEEALAYDGDYEEALQLLDYYEDHAQVMEAEKGEDSYFLIHENSIRQREYVNINQWHEAGYTGKGLTILHDDTGNTTHSLSCKDIIQTILPDARIIRGIISGSTDKNGVVEAFVTSYGDDHGKMLFDEFINKYGISMINNSKTGGKGDDSSKWSVWMNKKIKEHNLIGFGAAGNDDTINNRFYGSFIMVSGVYLKDDETILNYGATGDLDFSMFMGFQSGTSFASPFLCGMAGLLREKFPEITQEEVYDYLKNHSQKLGDEGKNIEYGWGLPILGNPYE